MTGERSKSRTTYLTDDSKTDTFSNSGCPLPHSRQWFDHWSEGKSPSILMNVSKGINSRGQTVWCKEVETLSCQQGEGAPTK